MNKSNHQLGSAVSSSQLIDAKLEEHQIQSCGSKQCPGCGHKLEGKPDWVGLPAGVKFDPTDQELIEHLEAKVEGKESKSHPLIDEFIPTIDGEDGICYTHPEKLPGVTRDGLSRHFFHRPSKAYTTGTRKRRKIQTESDLEGGETRWHKTGKTRPVMANGRQKGCKKILVLYTNFGKNRKPEKTSWVMHQYHLGQHEEEREGELVVSKIFYQTQPRQCNINTSQVVVDGGGGSSSSKMSMGPRCYNSSQDFSAVTAVVGPNITGYNTSIDHMQQFKADHFSFLPYRKSFDEGVEAFHVSRPTYSISPQPSSFHHVPTIMLPHHKFQQQEEAQTQHHHINKASVSGLEELIMCCSSTDIKQESSMENQQEAEWLKYSTYWPDPSNPHHHHG